MIPEHIRGELGIWLHTALRKQCDSSATSAAYNLIDLDERRYQGGFSLWAAYIESLLERWDGLQRSTSADEAAWWLERTTLAVLDFGGPVFAAIRDDESLTPAWATRLRELTHVWRCVFCCFADDDWRGYAAYLWRDE